MDFNMNYKGWNYFTAPTDTYDHMHCGICGNLTTKGTSSGPTSSTEAMLQNVAEAKGQNVEKKYHDFFKCPFSMDDWHIKALKLQMEAAATVSSYIKCLILEEVDDILLQSPATVDWLESHWNMKTPEGAASFIQRDCVKYYPDGFSGLYWYIVDDPMNERCIPKKLQPVSRKDVNDLFTRLKIERSNGL